MRNIKSVGSKSTEWRLRSSLVGAGISGFVMNDKTLPGKPDFVFFDQRLVVFVDGCFWHGCPQCYKRPKSNQLYWDKKYASNKKRDLKIDAELNDKGWNILRLWEHELKQIKNARVMVQDCLRQFME